MSGLIDFILHSDRRLVELAGEYGVWIYAILFLIVFAETGLVVTPFLPGDSLLFATGALSATGALNAPLAFALLACAAFAGDAFNYAVGRSIGPKVFLASDHTGFVHKLLNRDHLKRAHEFFERYGAKAVVLGRFVPIVRTFVPFVAGAARMTRRTFVYFNLVGAIGWVGLCLGAGWLFGNVPIIKENFSLVTIGIVIVSVLPIVVEYLRYTRKTKTA